MATQTTHYEFNKPSGTDLVNPLTDTNPNWDIADSALFELDERSICNCTEVVSLGVHTLSTLNTNTKFLKWIATANFTAGDTFVLNGDAVAASTPSGASLETNAYVAGSVVFACLNADNSAMTIYVSGTTTASNSERLGGELPSYYATDSDMTNAENDISAINTLLGNTSIVGIGDGTVTGIIAAAPEFSEDHPGSLANITHATTTNLFTFSKTGKVLIVVTTETNNTNGMTNFFYVNSDHVDSDTHTSSDLDPDGLIIAQRSMIVDVTAGDVFKLYNSRYGGAGYCNASWQYIYLT